jgi:ABC-2 type transport system permease protein
MLEIFINDWNRLLEEKLYLIVSMILTICAVLAAIVLTNTIQTKGNIALVVPDAQAVTEASSKFANSSYFNVSILETAPPKSQLVQNRYDAIVTVAEDSSYNIEVIKSDELKERITLAFKNPDTFVPNSSTQRNIGTNIIGYMMMFLLIQGLLYARLFAEDKEKQMIKRVVLSPIAFRNYLLGHAAFMLAMIFMPTFGVIVAAKIVGITVGFSLWVYAGLIAVLAMLSTAFALFLNSFFCVADTANMLGSSIIILSSILAGSFSALTKEDTVVDKLLHLLPQKDFINFTNALEKGSLTANVNGQFLYVIGLSILFFAIAVIKTRKDYIYHA